MALFVKREVTLLDTDWLGVPMAVRGVADTAELLAKRTENDGWFRRALLVREGATEAEITATIDAGLLEADGDMLRPVGWLDRNLSQEAIGAKKATRSEDGRRGNHTRWEHPGPFESCPKCQVVASSDRPSSPESESESEVEKRGDRPDPVVAIRSQQRGSADAPRIARAALAGLPGPSTEGATA